MKIETVAEFLQRGKQITICKKRKPKPLAPKRLPASKHMGTKNKTHVYWDQNEKP